MEWWTRIEPWDKALLFVLNLVTLAGLVVEHRRASRSERLAEEAHRLAVEAHGWSREHAERERQQAAECEARRDWCEKMRREVEASSVPLDIPDGVSTEWVLWGENERYFKRLRNPRGGAQLWRFGVK
jgi:hypothetical protein